MHSPFARWAWQYFTKCYNLKLSSNCNLGKDLKKNEGDDQLVKCNNTELYLQLYISNDHEKWVICPWVNNEKRIRKIWAKVK